MKVYHWLIALLFCALQIPAISAQEIRFNHLSTKENLSHYSVMAIYQDSFGQMWIGTRNGLNLYNGNDIQVFKHDKDNDNSIVSNSVRDITGSPDGRVFFLTVRGVSEYDVAHERFTTLTTRSVSAIYFWNTLYMALGNSICSYRNGHLETVYSLPVKEQQITSFLVDSDRIMIGIHEDGLYEYDRKRKTLTHVIEQEEITQIFKDRQKRFWVGTMNSGLYLIGGSNIRHYQATENGSSGLCANYIRDFCEDKAGNIWVGTFRGLNKYLPHQDSFVAYPNTSSDKHGTASSIWSLFCDGQGNVWAGTYFGGAVFFNPTQDFFSCYSVSDRPGEGLSAPIVGAMTEDDEQNLWICTEGGGLNRLDMRTGAIQWYRSTSSAGGLSQNNLKSIYFDEDRRCLWIGTHMGGLNRMDLKTGRFTSYRINPNVSHKSNIVCDIIPYKNHLLLATHDGVYQFDPEQASFKPLFKNRKDGKSINFALDICLDHQGMLWIAGAEKGAYAYDFVTDRMKLYTHKKEDAHSISSNGINCIYEDMDSNLWLCSAESGMDLYRYATDDFENFNEASHGLISNCIYGMCSIESGKLLVTTDCGLSYMDVKNRQFRNYRVNRNLPLSAINQNSIYRTSEGEVFIGGVDGMISFSPQRMNRKSQAYHIFPCKLFVNDREVEIGDDTGVLKESLHSTDCLTFSSSQSMFSIQYAVTNYSSFDQDSVQYRLENFSKRWTTMRSGHLITYTNLAAGTYRLVVRAVNNEGTEIASHTIRIVVLPPLYRTWWAYLSYFLICLLSVSYLVRSNYRKLKLQTELKYERNYIKNMEELNQSKLRFFTNISHEFCTPLTLIVGQMEMLLQNKTLQPMIYNKILRTYKNCVQLQELIQELIDFRKQDQGKMNIKVSEHNIVEFLYENYLLFQEYATSRHINFRFNKSTDTIQVWYDAKQLQKVVNNILSNAFRFTPDYGEISLSVAKHGSQVLVDVSDSGPGISQEDQKHLFERFYQTESSVKSDKAGAGIGLALAKGIVELHHGTIRVSSELGEGATFGFTLSVGKEQFSPEELAYQGGSWKSIQNDDRLKRGRIISSSEKEEVPEGDSEKHYKILIAEEDSSLRQMLQELLNPYYSTLVVSDGKEAMDTIRKELPDLVVADVMLKSMSGIELCKNSKSNLETCHIPVILLTARTAVENKMEGLLTGADDYVVKPFDIDILLARCKNLINTRLVLQEKFSKQLNSTPQIMATNPLDKVFVDKLMKIVEEHLTDSDFNISLFAQEMGFARTKLFVKLKAVTGQTPNEFIMTVRLRKAVRLLKESTDCNITEISALCGFSNPRYFSRCFKEKFGVTPQQYRREGAPQNNNEE